MKKLIILSCLGFALVYGTSTVFATLGKHKEEANTKNSAIVNINFKRINYHNETEEPTTEDTLSTDSSDQETMETNDQDTQQTHGDEQIHQEPDTSVQIEEGSPTDSGVEGTHEEQDSDDGDDY